VILHLQLLNFGDQFANFVQWFALVGSAVGVSLIARQLGADRFAQVLAALLAVTIPTGILQGSSTQNDYVVAFWLVCLAYFVLRAHQQRATWETVVCIGLSLGLMILTKGTAYLYALPFVLWFALSNLRRSVARTVGVMAAVGVIALSLNVLHFVRNQADFGSPLGPEAGVYANGVYSPAAVASNVIRNAALQLSLPAALDTSLQWSERLNRAIDRLHESVLGIDKNDPRTTWMHTTFAVTPQSLDEDYGGAWLHFLIALISVVLYGVRMKKQSSSTLFLLAVAAGALLFCILLKWQPFHTRLHLPFLVIIAPWTAFVLRAALPRAGLHVIALVLVLGALPPLFYNQTRPLLGESSILSRSRIEIMFAKRPTLLDAYRTAAALVHESGCGALGLRLGADSWEYPLWVLLAAFGDLPQIEHLTTPTPGTAPCVIIEIEREPLPADTTIADRAYQPVWSQAPVTIYAPAEG
jgi:4-amino-4-deoxy-L-arabinose transferase-like glycosyltransferase